MPAAIRVSPATRVLEDRRGLTGKAHHLHHETILGQLHHAVNLALTNYVFGWLKIQPTEFRRVFHFGNSINTSSPPSTWWAKGGYLADQVKVAPLQLVLPVVLAGLGQCGRGGEVPHSVHLFQSHLDTSDQCHCVGPALLATHHP